MVESLIWIFFSTFSNIANENQQKTDLDGVNILPYLSGEKEGEPERILFNKSGKYSFLIKDGWKLQLDLIQNKKWLFNLNDDPTEQLNLSKKKSNKIKRT